ncbi:helix-turn-helix domain-containing protein [Streptomyces sp. NPDC048278]|uniref:helix-turn-helix domain-containing protein n=1 Tax=Streptomyces sp. NPDC048278 TaxID=3155809 RepID=UPI003421E262
MTRADRLTLVRQHAAEGKSQRQIAAHLGISKDTVRRDLELLASQPEPQDEPADAPVDAPDDPDAPQVTEAAPAEAAPQDAPPAAPEPAASAARPVEGAPPVLPRRIPAHDRLTVDIDLAQWPPLRTALAELATTGVDTERLIVQALVTLASGYRQGVAAGDIRYGLPFHVRLISVGPPEPGLAVPRRPVPPAPAPGA